jgi:hypothetical protein
VDNSLPIVAALAAVVAVVATAVAWRAGRRARRAADLVAQLLEPPVLEPPVELPVAEPPVQEQTTAGSSSLAGIDDLGVTANVLGVDDTAPDTVPPGDVAADDSEPSPAIAMPVSAARDDRRPAPTNPSEGGDPAPTRIPVLDLDRLRSWLTLGDLNLGRLAIVSVELDNLGFVEERLGYAAGGHLIEAITQRLRTVTRPRDVVAHVNRERFVLVCRDVPDRQAAQGLADASPWASRIPPSSSPAWRR